MSADDKTAPRPVGNPTADRAREEALKHFVGDDKPCLYETRSTKFTDEQVDEINGCPRKAS